MNLKIIVKDGKVKVVVPRDYEIEVEGGKPKEESLLKLDIEEEEEEAEEV